MSVNVIYYFILYTYEINKTRIHIMPFFHAWVFHFYACGALNKNQWQNVASSLKTTNAADSVILVFI